MRNIRLNDRGAAVEDVQKRLRMLSYELMPDGYFGPRTKAAVIDFRQKEGLPEGDVVDSATWSALVDATFFLGDRMLYLRMPYFHGHDVRQLQTILNALGFVVGEADGIFGGNTEYALREFQSSIGLVDDGVAGDTTFDAIQRLRHAWEGKAAITEDTQEHMGFARAAEILENLEACFFGMDELGRDIATRAANLAQATTPFARIVSAESLTVAPPPSTLMIGLGIRDTFDTEGYPAVHLGDDFAFPQRLATAIKAAHGAPRKIFVELRPLPPTDCTEDELPRWRQHSAVLLIDALCSALA